MRYDRLRTRVLYSRTPVDEEVGSSSNGIGWAGLYMRWETEGGYILHEGSDGLVTSETYPTDAAIEAAWKDMCDALEVSGDPDLADVVIMENPKDGLFYCMDLGESRMFEEIEEIIAELMAVPTPDQRNYWFLNERGNFIPINPESYA